VAGYIPRWFTCPLTVSNPSSNHLIATGGEANLRPVDRKLSDALPLHHRKSVDGPSV